MMGSFSVGKTSLVRRYIEGIFSEKYLTTIGVKIDKKVVHVNNEDVTLMLWDLAGEDEFYRLRTSYLRGASGYLLVADGTRRHTLDKAIELKTRAQSALGDDIPFYLVINKADIKEQWDMDAGLLKKLSGSGWSIVETSAKTGACVESLFTGLAEQMTAYTRSV